MFYIRVSRCFSRVHSVLPGTESLFHLCHVRLYRQARATFELQHERTLLQLYKPGTRQLSINLLFFSYIKILYFDTTKSSKIIKSAYKTQATHDVRTTLERRQNVKKRLNNVVLTSCGKRCAPMML